MRTPTPQHGRRDGFTLIELAGSLAILVLLFACFYPALHGLRRAQAVFEHETAAVVVMGNVTERLAAAGDRSPEAVRRVFLEEYRLSALSQVAAVKPLHSATPTGCVLEIARSKGAPLARLEVPR